MTAIWTPPKTWSAGELVTAESLNQQLRDNLDYLKDRPAAWKHFVVNASTTSSSFVLVSTDLIMELVNPNQTGARGTFVIGISGSIKATAADTTFEVVPVKLLTNNTIESTLQQMVIKGTVSTPTTPFSMTFPRNFTEGTHRIGIAWRRLSGTGTLQTDGTWRIWGLEVAVSDEV